MKINIDLEVSESKTSRTVDTENLGFTESEWELLNSEQKREAIESYVVELSEQPYWMLDSFEE
jgi:hypothetical protein